MNELVEQARQPHRPEVDRTLDWSPSRAREFTDRAVDLWQEFLEHLPNLPVATAENETEVARRVVRAVPEQPLSDDELFAYLHEMVFDASAFPGHPRFMAYITGAGTVPGAAADLLASGLNMNAGGWRLAPSATEIEVHLTRWFASQFGLPATAGGLIVSGGAMANFVGLKAARDNRAGWDVRNEGVAMGPPLAFYASEEVHVVSDRAVDMLGLGTKALRKIRVDGRLQMDAAALREAIEADVSAGIKPVAVIATAGTVATGAIDPLGEIAALCKEFGVWLHIDAAYGGPAILTEDLRHLLDGIEHADSIAFDPHKWLYTPHSGGCVLVRDLQHLADAFAVHPTYVHEDKERSGHGIDLAMLGPQFSRGFQAFKIWLSLLAHGREAYANRISHDAALARYLEAKIQAREDFELVSPAQLSICCFRYVPPGLSEGPDAEAYLSELNERLMTAIHLDGRVYCSNAVLDGRFVLRACIVNFRTEAEDIDALVEVISELGAALDAELRPSTDRA
ncbi:MAG: aspartate aminotransferase family protein [Thermomicrobiales bacterium]